MVSRKNKNIAQRNMEEGDVISTSKAAYSDPKMLTISLYEIQSFLIAENIAKVILVIGTSLSSGVLSAVLSNVTVPIILFIISPLLFIAGLVLDIVFTYNKFKELKQRGVEKWN